jgi:putative ABC transport system ATP-binding protein
MGPLIRIRGLYKCYWVGPVAFPALNGVDLEVEAGELTVLSGRSGSGKTTLLNVVGGLEPGDRGEVRICGQDFQRLGRGARTAFRLHHIGFVFQAYNLIQVLTAEENVAWVCQLQGRGRAQCRALARHWLAEVGLAGLEGRRPAQLSGGQQQRVAVARALATQPDLVLADEPTANLDTATAADLIALLRDLNARLGITFLISSHDPDVKAAARRVVALSDGRVVPEDGAHPPPPEITAEQVCPRHERRGWLRRRLGGGA